MKSEGWQFCTHQNCCYRTSTAAWNTRWKYRSTTWKGCSWWRAHWKISCFPSASAFFIFSVTFIKLVQEKNVLNLSSGYRHFIWSLHRNPKQCHKVPGILAKIKPSGPCTLLFSNLFFHLMCQSKLLLQHGQNQPGWIYNASNCYGHIFVNRLETNR